MRSKVEVDPHGNISLALRSHRVETKSRSRFHRLVLDPLLQSIIKNDLFRISPKDPYFSDILTTIIVKVIITDS